MRLTEKISCVETFMCSAADSGLRLVAILILIGIGMTGSSLGQDATYSDTWTAETPNGEEALLYEEVQGYVNGAGVTEEDYTSYNTYKVETVMRSPGGRISRDVSYGSAGSIRTDVYLPMDLQNPEEGELTVDTNHYYSGYDQEAAASSGTTSRTELVPRSYFIGSVSRASGIINGYSVRYRYVRTLGTQYWYTRDCESIVCALPTSKYVSTSKWAYPRTFLNCGGFRLNVNLGLFRVSGCVGGCTGSELGTMCR